MHDYEFMIPGLIFVDQSTKNDNENHLFEIFFQYNFDLNNLCEDFMEAKIINSTALEDMPYDPEVVSSKPFLPVPFYYQRSFVNRASLKETQLCLLREKLL